MDKEQLKLNADLGEGSGNDEALMPYLTMCNISCGAHAGSPEDIEQTMKLAQKHGVKIGAHPSYPDKENFGRQVMEISHKELATSLSEQFHRFKIIAEKLGASVHHVKAHGALYHQVVCNDAVRNIYLQAIQDKFGDIPILIPSSFYNKASNFGNHKVVYEAFADRQYMPNLELAPRSHADAVLTKIEDLASQIHKMIDCGKVFTSDGSWQDIQFDTICIHGDQKGIAERLPQVIALLNNHNH